MTSPQPIPIDAALAAVAESRMPTASSGDTPALRQTIAQFLRDSEMLSLVTLGEHGWPVAHCMHFAHYLGAGDRPIVYMFTHEGKRKMANIAANPRVALTIFNPQQSAGESQCYLRLAGVARIVTDPGERTLAMEGQFDKPGYGFARQIGLETQPALRVDVTDAVWIDPGAGSSARIDYRPNFGATS